MFPKEINLRNHVGKIQPSVPPFGYPLINFDEDPLDRV